MKVRTGFLASLIGQYASSGRSGTPVEGASSSTALHTSIQHDDASAQQQTAEREDKAVQIDVSVAQPEEPKEAAPVVNQPRKGGIDFEV